MWRFGKYFLIIGLFLIITGLYWYGAVLQLTFVNIDMERTDQSAYMSDARKLHESNYTYMVGRNRMPIYPLFQSLVYRTGISDEEFFERGKYINLILSLSLLVGIALILYQQFHWLHALNLLLITAFMIFVFKAGWFQTELLFYFINFCLFLLMWKLLKHPSWKLAILTGFVAGLAHLTKASILPGLVIFLVSALAKWLWSNFRNLRSTAGASRSRLDYSYILVVVLVGGLFLITIFPYIHTSKRVFGQYFYNVNSTFYFWYDSWQHAKKGTWAHGDKYNWPDMPPDEIPNMSKYLREHTKGEIIRRFLEGGQKFFGKVVQSYGYFKYLVIYPFLLAIAIIWFRGQAFRAIKSDPIQILFPVTYFVVYILLYSWYAPIVSGNRLFLSQFLPFMYIISVGLHAFLLSPHITIGRYSISSLVIVNSIILPVVIIDIYLVLTVRITSILGGS